MLRREALKTGLAALSAFGLGTMGYLPAVTASESPVAHGDSGLCRKLAAALRSIGNEGCIAAAERLDESTGHRHVQLHLRGVGLDVSDTEQIADALRPLTDAEASSLASLSLSYNAAIGDAGAIPLAHALPRSLPELGLVDCKIGDTGGAALLEWARQATRLRMLCVEGNEFSEEIRTRFSNLVRANPSLSVFA